MQNMCIGKYWDKMVPRWWDGRKHGRGELTKGKKKGEKKLPASSGGNIIVNVKESIKQDVIRSDHTVRRLQYRKMIKEYRTKFEQRQQLGGTEDLMLPSWTVSYIALMCSCFLLLMI
jgi:hypothetical protein